MKYSCAMQINIDKKTGILLGIIAALVLAVVFMLTGNSGTSMGHSGHGSGMTNEERSSEYSSNELMFAQMMIPHHEQAVTMSELALENTTNPDVIALATAIRDAQGPEIKQNLIIKSFIKYKVGEGIEVKKTDFNEEVKSLAGA